MGKLWYLVRKEESVFVKYVDGTEFVNQRTNIPFGAVYNVAKLRMNPESQYAIDVSCC